MTESKSSERGISDYTAELGITFVLSLIITELALLLQLSMAILVLVVFCLSLVGGYLLGREEAHKLFLIPFASLGTYFIISAIFSYEELWIGAILGLVLSFCIGIADFVVVKVAGLILKRRFGRRQMMYTFLISVAFILVYLAYPHSPKLIAYLDEHQWIVTILSAIVTLIGGFLIGKRAKK